MQKLNFQSEGSQRDLAELFEMCPPQGSVGLRGGYECAPRDYSGKEYHEFDNL